MTVYYARLSKTVERYRQLLAYPIEALGHVPMRELSTLMLERFYNALLETPARSGRPLAPKSIRHIHDCLRSSFKTAIRWDVLKVNPAAACKLPKVETKKAGVLEDEHFEFLLDAARSHPWMYALLFVASATGLRRGELLALVWADLDLIHNSMLVSKSLEQTKAGLRIKTPKSDKDRTLTLPATAVDVLKEHRRRQQEFRGAFGDDYRTDLDLVFATPKGDYLKPNTVSPAVCELARKCGFKGVGLHTLRHTHGSQLISAGVPLPVVSKRLGHSSVDFTLRVYAHAFDKDEVAAAEIWDQKIGAAILRQTPWQHVAARRTH